MGRYFANGIPINIRVILKENCDKEENDFEIIKNHLSKYFNLDTYDINPNYDNGFEFVLRKDVFFNNIHDCYRELSRLMRYYSDDIFKTSEKFDEKYKDMDLTKIMHENPLLFNEGNFLIDEDCIYGESRKFDWVEEQWWLYWDCDLLGRSGKYWIHLDIISLGYDINKFFSEDETYLLYVVNSMKNANFENELSKNNLFFIVG